MPFSIGDLVVLKSGGPTMTVWEVDRGDAPIYRTCWFVGGILHRDAFSEPELVEHKSEFSDSLRKMIEAITEEQDRCHLSQSI